MPNDFIVRPKCTDKKEDKSITMTIRLERELQEQYDDLSAKSGRSSRVLSAASQVSVPNMGSSHMVSKYAPNGPSPSFRLTTEAQL